MSADLGAATDAGAVSATIDGPLATVTLDRPTKRNALSTPMWQRVGELVPELAATSGVRVVALRGAGDCFSAGADLDDVLAATRDLDAARAYCQTLVRTLTRLAWCEVPTIAAVDGVASGGGVELALAADNRIATPRSSFQLPFARLGVVPDGLTLRRLTESTGRSGASWMMLTGRAVPARTAVSTGLVDELVEERSLDEALGEVAAAAAETSFPAFLRARELIKRPPDAGDVVRDAEQMARSFVSGPVRDQALRFLERRRSGPEI